MGRWLGVEAAGAAAQPHVLLVAVPYALKAADADTLGGKPASAYLVAPQSGEAGSAPASGAATGTASLTTGHASPKADASEPAILAGAGTANYLPLWTNVHFLGNSLLFQSGSNVGIGTTTPGAALDTVGAGLGVRGTSSGTTGTGVFGQATSTTGVNFGVSGVTSSTATSSAAVNGWEGATTGQVYGVAGYTSSTTTYASGVVGHEGATTGQVFGVSGTTNSATDNAVGVSGFEGATTGAVFGVSGGTISTSNGAAGVNGWDNATTGQVYGVNGYTASISNGAAAVNGFEGAATGTVYGVSGGTSSPDGFGVFGSNSATSGYPAGTGGLSASSSGYGVFGYNSSATCCFSPGVFGVSVGGTGVAGQATTTTGPSFGVQGFTASPDGVGVQGQSPGGVAVAGINYSTCTSSACTLVSGTAGQFSTGTGGTILQGFSGSSTSSVTEVFSVDASGDLNMSGNLTVTGTKSSVAQLQDGRRVALYAVESPDNWFEDFGSAQLQNGVAAVALEATFAQTVNAGMEYHVFLTPNGDCHGLYVASKTPAGFEVRELGGGTASIAFDYRIVARRRGFETVRLQEVHAPQGVKEMAARFAGMQSPGHVAVPRSVLPPQPPKITIPPTPNPAERLR
jgi:hypothetical protein